jgi:hypothetical protein
LLSSRARAPQHPLFTMSASQEARSTLTPARLAGCSARPSALVASGTQHAGRSNGPWERREEAECGVAPLLLEECAVSTLQASWPRIFGSTCGARPHTGGGGGRGCQEVAGMGCNASALRQARAEKAGRHMWVVCTMGTGLLTLHESVWGGASQVTWEDQQRINSFGTLNNRLHEVRAELGQYEVRHTLHLPPRLCPQPPP